MPDVLEVGHLQDASREKAVQDLGSCFDAQPQAVAREQGREPMQVQTKCKNEQFLGLMPGQDQR